MPVLQPQLTHTTLEEYDALPEDTRAEIFDGQIFYMPVSGTSDYFHGIVNNT